MDVSPADASPTVARASPYAWYVTSVLGLGQLVSVLDRYLMGVVTEPMRRDLRLTDSQLGLLMGPAFMFLYILASPPLGRAADVVSRRMVILLGVLTWTLASAYCAIARNFSELVAARVFIGFGEAALVPAAMSLIAAYFPPAVRYRAVSVFTAGQSLGRGGAFLGGGALLAYFSVHALNAPVLGALKPWQGVFLASAVIGLVVALLVLTIREPARARRKETGGGMSEALGFFWTHRRAYISLFVAFSMATLVSYVFASWTVSFCVREHGVSPGRASMVIGACSLVVGPAGNFAGGWFSDQLQRRKVVSPHLWSIMGSLLLAPVFALGFWFAPTFALAMVAYLALYFVITATAGPGFGGMQAVTPTRHLGVISSLFVISFTLAGVGIGPLLIGLMSDYLFKSDRMLGPAIFSATALAAFAGLIAIFYGLRKAPLAQDPAYE
jgi:MFS family permease